MTAPGDRTYLFLHLMKTGGTSLFHHLIDTFGSAGMHPDLRSPDAIDAERASYGSLSRLRAATARRPRPRAFAGHLPFLAVDIVEPDVTVTILREPVDRAISALRQLQRNDGPSPRSLEELYEEHEGRWSTIQDYQVRQFALTIDELDAAADQIDAFFPGQGDKARDAPHYVHVPVDDRRLARAIDNLRSVEVVGLQSSFEEMLDELRSRHGWNIPAMHRRRVAGSPPEVPSSLRSRIAEDCAADVAFYRAAVDLVASRRRP